MSRQFHAWKMIHKPWLTSSRRMSRPVPCLSCSWRPHPAKTFPHQRRCTGFSYGAEQKFTAFCGLASRIEMNIPYRRVGHLVENVVMERGEAEYFASRLDCSMIVVDAQHLGIISRPRLWWMRIDWSKMRTSPLAGMRMKWTKTQKFHRLHQDGPL